MRVELHPPERLLLALGVGLSAVTLVAAFWWPEGILAGWLSAAAAFGAVPAGALMLLMMMRLIPGAWGEELRLSTEAATMLAPLAALLFAPVLIGIGAIYPWVHDRAALNGFQRVWLAPLPFVAVTALRFGALIWLGMRMRRRRATSVTAAAGLLALPLLESLAAVHWLMSLDPAFASSAFGLQFLLREVTIAFATLVLLRLVAGRIPPRLNVIGGLLLTLLLLWGYFAFLPFFIAWSGNLPPNAAWYLSRWRGAWAWVEGWVALLNGVPLLLLLFAPVRRSPRWLTWLSALVLLAQWVEFAWIVLPGRSLAASAAFVVATIGIGAILTASLRIALRKRIHARALATAS